MKIGMQELVIVFIVALIVIGPDKLPEYARKFGEALKTFKKYSSEATKEIRESVVEPLAEAQKPLREAMEPITDLEKSMKKEVKDLKQSFTDIGKEPKADAAPKDDSAAPSDSSEGSSVPDDNTEAVPADAGAEDLHMDTEEAKPAATSAVDDEPPVA